MIPRQAVLCLAAFAVMLTVLGPGGNVATSVLHQIAPSVVWHSDEVEASHCNVTLVDAPNQMQFFWNNDSLKQSEASDYFATPFAVNSINRNVSGRYFHVRRDCQPLREGKEAGAWSLPKNIWISQPCFIRKEGTTTASQGSHIGLTTCACDAKVVAFDDVYWLTRDARNRYDIMSIAISKLRHPVTDRLEWFAIDRSNLNLGKMRCVNDFPTGSVQLQELLDELQSRCPSQSSASYNEVYFPLGTILVPPAHRLESVMGAAAHYYAAGLHTRNVPWVLPTFAEVKRRSITSTYLEITTLLNISVVFFNEGDVQHAAKIHFFEDEHGENFMCQKPFLQHVMWPRVLELATAKNWSIFENVSFIKNKEAVHPDLFTPARGHYLSPAFLNFSQQLHMPFFNVLPLAEKMFYVNTATNIISSWGGAASFVFLLMMPRRVNVVVVVHKRYSREAAGTLINFRSKRPIELSPVFNGAISRNRGLKYDYEHPEFKARFVLARNLEVLMVDNFFTEMMKPHFTPRKSWW